MVPWEGDGNTDDVVDEVLARIDKNRAKEDCSAVPPHFTPMSKEEVERAVAEVLATIDKNRAEKNR